MPRVILYHGFGIRGCQHLRTQFKEGCIYLHLVRSFNLCSFFHSFKVTHKGVEVRTLRTLPIGKRRVFVLIRMRRFSFEECRRIRFEDLLIAETRKHYTRALERYVRELCLVLFYENHSLGNAISCPNSFETKHFFS